MAPVLWKDDDEPELGDLIEIFRTGYKHWAVYVGSGYIIHLAPPCELSQPCGSSLMSVVCEKAVIRKDLLREVAGGNRYRVNNKLDSKYSPQPVNKIVREAERQVGKEVPYNLATKNCEHFVTELRYGCGESQQVREAVGAGVGAGVVLFGVLAGIGYFMSRNRQDRNNQ
ncbi:phospholipase A and acyltransferase 3-like isoform X2 [Acipenser oxyrinchus oxyrinchus]|uniref:Phospholipase A and acyltransferase 3-like isoform X2 n=1 Tax=Acipenser oxyrinchus oxyrinchus TaxID=40147 RepID=A0AAD8FR07_ACIOX|nr:phospholipase A and acyltransferase 3-like isoform X2 [Acipenser oxyrinchus oxyrinchus]